MSLIQDLLPPLIPALKELVHYLVIGDYAHLEEAGLIAPNSLLTSEEIARIIADYGATLIDLPDEALATDDVLEDTYRGPVFDGHGIHFDLWTAEEGRSDLTLYVTLSYASITGDEAPAVQIEDLRGFPPKLIPPLQAIIHQLVIGDYAGLERDGRLRRYGLTAPDLEAIITEYHDRVWENRAWPNGTTPSPDDIASKRDCVLVDMPASAFKHDAQAYPIYDEPNSWAADIDLWWANQCMGNQLTLRVEIESTPEGIDIQIMNLEVM